MKTILVVDDMPIIRDPIAAMLGTSGYRAVTAGNGADALKLLHVDRADLILLDVMMPGMDGLTFLQHVRSNPSTKHVPVIMLSGEEDRNEILRAGKLGIQGYVLKSTFSLKDLLNRVRTQLEPAALAKAEAGQPKDNTRGQLAPPVSTPANSQQTARLDPTPASTPVADKTVAKNTSLPSRLLTREACIERAENALGGKTLSGVASQVISTAASPRSDMGELAKLIGRDAMLSTRILHAANSALYGAGHPVSSVSDAVRQVGFSGVRNIAAAIGVYDAMPATGADGFNPLLSWRHSFAVATLCARLAAEGGNNATVAGLAYLVGLCHDLGEILFRTTFAAEYHAVIEAQSLTGKSRKSVELALLGITHGELVGLILKHLGLPDTVRQPIEAFHSGRKANDADAQRLVSLLQLAERGANGALLAAATDVDVEALTNAEFRAATGTNTAQAIDWEAFRSEILAVTATLARLSAADEAKLVAPLYKSVKCRVWIARDAALSSFDPITAAVQSMAAPVTLAAALPDANAVLDCDAVVILARHESVPGFTVGDMNCLLQSCPEKPPRLLWLVKCAEGAATGRVEACQWPISLSRIADFLGTSIA